MSHKKDGAQNRLGKSQANPKTQVSAVEDEDENEDYTMTPAKASLNKSKVVGRKRTDSIGSD